MLVFYNSNVLVSVVPLFIFISSHFIITSIEARLVFNEKERHSIWVVGEGRKRGNGKYNQDILYEKKPIFNKMKKKSTISFFKFPLGDSS